jgi:hypothetical protein
MHVSTLAKNGHTLPAVLADDLIESAKSIPAPAPTQEPEVVEETSEAPVEETAPVAADSTPPQNGHDSDDSDDEVLAWLLPIALISSQLLF